MLLRHFAGSLLLAVAWVAPVLLNAQHLPEMQAALQQVRVHLVPDLKAGSVSGRAHYEMRSKSDSTSRIVLRVRELQVDSVRIDQQPAIFRVEGDTLTVEPAQAIRGGFRLSIWYRSVAAVRGVLQSATDSVWYASKRPGHQAGWMPSIDHAGVYALTTLSMETPPRYTLASAGQRTADSLTSGGLRYQEFQTQESMRLTDFGWALGPFTETRLADSQRFIQLFISRRTRWADSAAVIGTWAREAIQAVTAWNGADPGLPSVTLVLNPDQYGEPQVHATAFSLISTNARPLKQEVRMAVLGQVLGGILFPVDSTAARWLASARALWYEKLFGESSQALETPPFLSGEMRPMSDFELSEGVIRRWVRERGEAHSDDLLEWAWEADGLSHFGLKAAGRPPKKLPYLNAYWVEGKPPRVEFFMDSTAPPIDFTLLLFLRRDTLKVPVHLTPDSILELDMRTDVRNMALAGVPQGFRVLVKKPDAMWIHQVRTSTDPMVKSEGVRALRGVRNKPDLQLFLNDLLKTERNPQLRAEVLSTLAAYMNGATGTAGLFLDELASPDSAVRRQAVRALRFYGVQSDHAARLTAELRKARTTAMRSEIAASMSVAMDSAAWVRLVERSLTRQENTDLHRALLKISAQRFPPASFQKLLRRWHDSSVPPWTRTLILSALPLNDPDDLIRWQNARASGDVRLRAAALIRDRKLGVAENIPAGIDGRALELSGWFYDLDKP